MYKFDIIELMKFLRGTRLSIRFFIVLGVFLGLAALALGRQFIVVQAEQSGGSPTAGADSRIKQLADALISANYGSTDEGSWGDWGDYWNRISSAARAPFNDALIDSTKNGSGAGSVAGYTKALGGVDDYNNNQTIPSDTYKKSWTVCNADNSYCNTSDSNAERQDPNTGLIWSSRISSSANWFTANNCQQPSNGVAPTGANACSSNGDVGCVCTKLSSSKTGCEALGDGNWRLPYQKELMLAYIDGSYSELTNSTTYYWSSTTTSTATQQAWSTYLYHGITINTNKTSNVSVRCVR